MKDEQITKLLLLWEKSLKKILLMYQKKKILCFLFTTYKAIIQVFTSAFVIWLFKTLSDLLITWQIKKCLKTLSSGRWCSSSCPSTGSRRSFEAKAGRSIPFLPKSKFEEKTKKNKLKWIFLLPIENSETGTWKLNQEGA